MTKYLIDKYEDSTSQQYAIGTVRILKARLLSSVYSGLKVLDDTYKGIYEWDRVDNTAAGHLDDATLSFKNWIPCKTISDVSYQYFLLTAAPTGFDCVTMTVGVGDPNNGRLVFTKISSQ